MGEETGRKGREGGRGPISKDGGWGKWRKGKDGIRRGRGEGMGEGDSREGRREQVGEGREMEGEKRGREGVHNLRKTTPRHQMAGYGPSCCIIMWLLLLLRKCTEWNFQCLAEIWVNRMTVIF